MKNATITREYNLIETKGTFVTDGFTCYTLELPWLNNQHNISCIPEGTYKCVFSHMGNMNLDTFLVTGVDNRSGIFIHYGNYAAGKQIDTEGCILVGDSFSDRNGDGIIDVVNSRATLAKLKEVMGTDPFMLTITSKKAEEPAPVVNEVQANAPITPVAPANPAVTLSAHDQFFNWLSTSSADPEKTSLTVKGLLLGLIPMAASQLQTLGVNINALDLTHSLDVSIKYLAIALFLYGIGRKAYYQVKQMLNK